MNSDRNKPMQRITMQDLDNSITQAQRTTCLNQRRQIKCPICEAPKAYGHCLCQRCFHSLPESIRGGLYLLALASVDALDKWIQNFLAAKDYLRQMGMGETA